MTGLGPRFLLEDHSLFRKALADLLGRQPDLKVVAEAGSLAEARREAAEKAERIDLAVVDLLLPDGIGTELIRDLRADGSRVPVLVLTVAQGPDLRAWVRSMGADEMIFAAEGHGTKAIQTRLYREGIPSPTGKETWHRPVLKRMVLSDIYKPHTYEEALELVPQAVAAVLEEGGEYGIRWWNRSSQKSHQVSETGRDGQRRYRRQRSYVLRAQDEWIAAVVPAFLPARSWSEAVPENLDRLTPNERNELYRMLRLEISPAGEGFEVTGPFCRLEPLSF